MMPNNNQSDEGKNSSKDMDMPTNDDGRESPESSESDELASSSEGELFGKRRRVGTPVSSPFKTPPGSPFKMPMTIPSPSPPQWISLEELMTVSNGVTNMALAHEIAVDNDFQLQKYMPPENSLEKQVKDTVHRAFWDALREELAEEPPTFQHAINLLGEVKEMLVSILLPQHSRLRAQINEVLDLDLITQEAEHGALDVKRCARFVIDTMGRLCAPVRDQDIETLREVDNVVDMFKEIFRVLELMKMDMANFTIQSMRPTIQQHSVEYERKKFQEFIDKQPNALEVTKTWLYQASEKVKASQLPSGSAEGATAAADRLLTPMDVLGHAYIMLLKWEENKPFPETVLMDQGRLAEIGVKCRQITLIASILLITHNVVGAALAGLQGFSEKLKGTLGVLLGDMQESSFNLEEALKNISEQVCKEVDECLETRGFPRLDEKRRDILKVQVQTAANPDNYIHNLITSRVYGFIQSVITAPNPASQAKVPGGLTMVKMELFEATARVLRIVRHNNAVFGPYYSDIISGLLPAANGPSE
ncbi:T-complex protein 11 [Branchiostoma belcheri]|nr:T-complex protein 11 [Branchiostoma belcheri]